MIIEEKYKISKDSDLLYTRIDISNKLKKHRPEYVNFFSFAIMELGTNIIKYAIEGEIWLLKEKDEYLLAALDKGSGIENLQWSLKKGTTTYKNSLGLGLYQLSINDFFDFKIFTSTDKIKGSVFLLKPKILNNSMVILSDNYMGLEVSGDFFVKKGRFFMLGDVSGHGLKASKAAEFIKKYFLNTIFSCSISKNFFKELDSILKQNSFRSVVLGVGEINKQKLNICGVGNIQIMYKEAQNITKKSFNSGIVGEVFSSVSTYSYNFTKDLQFFMFSDGIDEERLYNIIKLIDDIYLTIICAVFYSNRVDDKIILAIRG